MSDSIDHYPPDPTTSDGGPKFCRSGKTFGNRDFGRSVETPDSRLKRICDVNGGEGVSVWRSPRDKEDGLGT